MDSKDSLRLQRTLQFPTRGSALLAMLLAVVLLSRLACGLIIQKINGYAGFLSRDTVTYVESAQSLLHASFSRDGIPEIFRTPGYPIVLLPAVALQHWVVIALLENFLLAICSACLIWRLLIDLFPDSKAAFWAALLYCFEPLGFLYSEKVLSETLFSTQLLLFVWLMAGFLRKPTYAKLLLSALALACAAYTRPVTLFLGLGLIPVLLLFPRAIRWPQRVSRAILFPVVFALTLTPWILRNREVAGYTGFSSVSDQNLYFYSAAAVRAKLEHRGFSQVQEELGWNGGTNDRLYLRIHPEERTWSQGQVQRFVRAEAEKVISQHLLSYSFIHARGCAVVMFDPAVTDALKVVRLYPESGGLSSRAVDQGLFWATLWLIWQYPIAAAVLLLLGAQLILSYALGLMGLRRLPLDVAVLLVFLVCYFLLVSGGPAGAARLRTPIMPLVCIMAGVALADWRAKKREMTPGSSSEKPLA